ncbi:MAG TPA: secretin N-terminal domain-containing protein, partial [Burkholderiaceae bacterium]
MRSYHLLGWCMAALAAAVTGCQSNPPARTTRNSIDAEMQASIAQRPAAKLPDQVGAALLPPLMQSLPKAQALPEQRFDLVVNNASVQQVCQAIASGSRYSIIVPPGLNASVTVALKDVTVREALDVLRELHGLEYRIDGTRVFIQPPVLQTRLFQVAYPSAKRIGRSDTKVISGSISSNNPSSSNSAVVGGVNSTATEGSQISTTTDVDFWKELDASLKALIGAEGGRQIVTSQHAGIIVVRAFPRELREVESFLRASRLAIERQVMLEAKIVEVSLSEGFESGINWAALAQGTHRFSVGADASRINVPGSLGSAAGIPPGSIVTPIDATTTPPTVTPTTLAQLINSPFASGSAGVLGMAFTNSSFNALLAFLETQGAVHVLSSPRVAAVNNQKAVLRVGTDDFFITNISATTVASSSGTVTTPTITVQPFFS